MSGTRLLIQALFSATLVTLIVLSFYAGLGRFDDWLFLPFSQKMARKKLEQHPQEFYVPIKIHPATFLSAGSEMAFWKETMDSIKQPDDQIKYNNDPNDWLDSICPDPSQASAVDLARIDLIACDKYPTGTGKPAVVVRNTSTIYYPSSLEARKEEMSLLFPSEPNRTHMEIALMVEDDGTRSDRWATWMHLLNARLQKQRVVEWPCLLETPRLDVSVVHLSSQIIQKGNESILAADVLRQRKPPRVSRCSQVYLYIPATEGVLISDQGVVGKAIKAQDDFLMILNPTPVDENDTRPAFAWMMSKCAGAPLDLNDQFSVQVDDSYPKWFAELWYQRMLIRRYREVPSMASAERNQLLNLDPSIRLPLKPIMEYFQILKLMKHAQLASEHKEYRSALHHLDQAYSIVQAFRSNPILLRPLDFAWDQYAAIFAPILVPLLLPALAGVWRELQRFRKMNRVVL